MIGNFNIRKTPDNCVEYRVVRCIKKHAASSIRNLNDDRFVVDCFKSQKSDRYYLSVSVKVDTYYDNYTMYQLLQSKIDYILS